MKTRYGFNLTAILLLMALTSVSRAAVIWDGPSITFTKADSVDWTLPANQDFLTANVVLTRESTDVLFNIAGEASPTSSTSPVDTEWAVGDINDWATLTYESFLDYGLGSIGGAGFTNALSQPSVLHLISDDIYIPIQFNSWSKFGAGGFSYTRGTANVNVVVAPEPTAILLLGMGLTGLFARAVKRNKM